MNNPNLETAMQLAALALVGLFCWLGIRTAATTDGRLAVENALHRLRPADVESVTVFPTGPGPTRPFQLRTAAGIAPLLPALRQLTAIAADPHQTPLLLATVQVRLRPAAVAAWHLRNRELIFRLAVSGEGDIAQRATSDLVYQSTALNRQVRLLRDSLSRP